VPAAAADATSMPVHRGNAKCFQMPQDQAAASSNNSSCKASCSQVPVAQHAGLISKCTADMRGSFTSPLHAQHAAAVAAAAVRVCVHMCAGMLTSVTASTQTATLS
jgi:hypothetical protein